MKEKWGISMRKFYITLILTFIMMVVSLFLYTNVRHGGTPGGEFLLPIFPFLIIYGFSGIARDIRDSFRELLDSK